MDKKTGSQEWSRNIISTPNAPAAIGPYSQAINIGPLVFISGQIPLDPVSGNIVPGDIKDQTRRVLTNIREILTAAGTSLEKVVKVMVFLKNVTDFSAMNEVYAQFFPQQPPARACVEVARLPRDVLIEIDAIALS